MTRVVLLHGVLGLPEAWAPVIVRVTELRPDGEASRRVWQRYDALWA